MSSSIVRPINVSYTAPDLPRPLVSRPHLISAILQLFDSVTDTVCVEGRAGYGKTTLLREFAEVCTAPCFSIFLRAGSRHSYDPVLARVDLANQLYWHLESRRLPDTYEPTDGDLRTLVRRCGRHLSRRNSAAYFIVDGLHHIPLDDATLLQAIIALLPFGSKPFRFLLSSDILTTIFPSNQTVPIRPFVLMPFSSHESDEFFSGIIDDKSHRAQYHKTLGGVPALLASARRQLLSSATGKQIQLLPPVPDLDTFHQAEWDLLTPLSERTEAALAYILAYGRPVSVPQLCQHLNLSSDRLNALLGDFPFLSYSTNLGGWDFASDPFRQYAATKLRSRVAEATEAIATKLLQDPDSEAALALLPQYLERAGQSAKILEWLDEHRLAKILFKARTPAWTEPILRNAIGISYDSRNDRALTTYSILRSIVPQISHTTGIDQEIRARCILGDFDGAQAVANDVPLLTQRLRLLAVLVDAASESPGVDTETLKREVRDLLQQVDVTTLPTDEAIDIAIDLYPVEPDAALKLLKTTIKDDMAHDSMDVAIARITIAALQSQRAIDSSADPSDDSPKTTDILVDERIKTFIDATRFSLTARSGADVMSLSRTIAEPADRLFVLRTWIAQHPDDEGVLYVIEATLNDALAAVEFAPTATFYREVLSPLVRTSDRETRTRLVAMVDAQQPVIRKRGPTIDYVRTQLILAFSDYHDSNFDRTVRRLEDLYLDCLDGIADLETRAACLAWCLGDLENYDSSRTLDQFSQFRELVEADFEKALSSTIADGANHFVILEKALEPLALYLPLRALDVVSTFNTANRRDQGRLHLARVLCDALPQKLDFAILFGILDGMDAGPQLDLAISTAGIRLGRHIHEGFECGAEVHDLVSRLQKCPSPATRAECLGRVAAALGENTPSQEVFQRVRTQLLTDFATIGSPSTRYTAGCTLIVLLQPSCPDLAQTVFASFSETNDVPRIAENVDQGSFYIIDLLIKATHALSRAKLLRDNDLSRIREMVAEVRDPYLRVRLLSRLAFFFWYENEQQHFGSIVTEDLWSALNDIGYDDLDLTYRAWGHAYGVVWLGNRDRARVAVENYPRAFRNNCVANLCFSLLRKQPPGEPFDGQSKTATAALNYSDIHNLLDLCRETDEDQLIFNVFEGIADQVMRSVGGATLTHEQKAEMARLMTEISETRLPSPAGIQHAGFQIMCKAQALRISKNTNRAQWNELVAAGERLTNSADRVFVTAYLASYLPNRSGKERVRLFEAVETATEALPSVEDRCDRYAAIAHVAIDTDRRLAARVTEKAFHTMTASDDRRNASREPRLVDLAYRVDPELPMKLAVLYDDDPAREKYRERARRQLSRQELKKELGDHKQDIVLRDRQNEPDLAAAAWLALGTLNAGRMIAVDMARVRDMLACASNYPLETSYPMYSWVLSNVMGKYAGTRQAAEYIRDLFEGLVCGARFFFLMTGSSGGFEFNPKWRRQDDDDIHTIIQVGEHGKAVKFLKKWFDNNADDVVTIVDPYFGPKDLWVVRLVMESNPHVTIRIVTSISGSHETGTGRLADVYSSAWRSLCDQEPPYTEVFAVGLVGSGMAPFHDRWILSKSTGLRMGTSFNSIGNKVSEISLMRSKELEGVQYTVEKYRKKSIREQDGQRIAYESFELLP